MRIPNFELFFLFHGDKFSTNFMEAFNDAPALFRTWSLQSIGIMAEQVLVDARDSADGCNRGIWGAHLQQSSGIEVIFEFVIPIAQPLRHIVTISNHPFNMKYKCFTNFINQLIIRFGSNNYSTWYILA